MVRIAARRRQQRIMGYSGRGHVLGTLLRKLQSIANRPWVSEIDCKLAPAKLQLIAIAVRKREINFALVRPMPELNADRFPNL